MSASRTAGIILSTGSLALLGAAQCARQQPDVANEPDSARVARLDREAREIAKTDGCSSADQCRTAPVGDRPCGGPRTYLVYCARTTDSTALNHKLAELVAAERAMNLRTGAMSTCEFRMPPQTALVDGSCRALSAP
jgi:hypothetical protein